MIHSAIKKVSSLMRSHVPALKGNALFLSCMVVPCGPIPGGISLTLSVVCRNTGGGVSALAAIILQVHNTEGR